MSTDLSFEDATNQIQINIEQALKELREKLAQRMDEEVLNAIKKADQQRGHITPMGVAVLGNFEVVKSETDYERMKDMIAGLGENPYEELKSEVEQMAAVGINDQELPILERQLKAARRKKNFLEVQTLERKINAMKGGKSGKRNCKKNRRRT